ncbi:alpha/beta fold hydrolase [Streptomyces mirabilis]|uniref:alpha/beta fold hydrolase n=1 Tax=Streptomyces mirabilis TaxID=68239 RepID=UPI00369524B5
MRTERVGTSDVRFRRQGEGDFAVVFVHGFLDDQYVWDGLVGELTTPGIACVTLGLAKSDRTQASGPFTYARFADEVRAVADALGKPFVIVGQSLGSAVAELVAAQHPDRALGLVLVTPVPLAGTRHPDEVMEHLPAFTTARHQPGGNGPPPQPSRSPAQDMQTRRAPRNCSHERRKRHVRRAPRSRRPGQQAGLRAAPPRQDGDHIGRGTARQRRPPTPPASPRCAPRSPRPSPPPPGSRG